MAKTNQNQTQVVEPKIEVEEEPVVETVETPETPGYRVEQSGVIGDLPGTRMPDIRGGVCEFCGPGEYDHSSPQRLVKDETVDPDTQIGRCKHYKGVRIRCSYCPLVSEWKDNILHRMHQIWESPPGSKRLIIFCGNYECRVKHLARAKQGR